MTPAVDASLPLTSGQRNIWLDQALHPEAPHYNVGGYLAIQGPLDAEVFRRALDLVTARCDALSIRLEAAGDLATQRFSDQGAPPLVIRDLSDQDDPESAALGHMEEVLVRPFQLLGGRLHHFELLRLGPELHYWVVAYHHLIVDGWSNALINQEVARTYTALIRGETPETEPLPSYAKVIETDQRYAQSKAAQADRAYWQGRFADLPEPLPLHPLAQHPPGTLGRKVVTTIPRERMERAEALAASLGGGIQALFLALLQAYAWRVHGLADLVVGVPLHNRPTAEFKRTVGCLVKMLPTRMGRDGADTPAELIRAVAARLRADYRHYRFPLSEINGLAGLRKSGRERLFDLTFSYNRHDYNQMAFAESLGHIHTLPIHLEPTPLALTLSDYHQDQDPILELSYQPDYFDQALAERWWARLDHLLVQVLDDPHRPLERLEAMPPAERRWLVDELNQTTRAFDPGATALGLCQERAQEDPLAPALVWEGGSLNRGDLLARAYRLAGHLRELGVGRESVVGLLLERSPQAITALLAVMAAGGAFLPLDPESPPERVARLAREGGAELVLTTSDLASGLDPCGLPLVLLDQERPPWRKLPPQPPGSPPRPGDLAYMIHTAGSTGEPRAVMVEHAALSNHLLWMQERFPLSPADRMLQRAPLIFDTSLMEILTPLMAGAVLVLARPGGQRDPAYLVRLIQDQGITVMETVPTFLPALLAEPGWPRCHSLRRLSTGGEALAGGLARQVLESLDLELVNFYGPTEATIGVTSHAARRLGPGLTMPIGRPMANARAYVVDPRSEAAPCGVAGELWVGGACLARGYRGQPELSAESFIADPFRHDPGARVYRTGDLTRWLPDGTLEHLGRLDHQVQLGGVRIEPAEVEAVLAGHPGVAQAVVALRRIGDTGPRLVAYLVARNGASPDEAGLRQYLQDRLPPYMVPTLFKALEHMPLLPSGKVDRRALPDPEPAREEAPSASASRLEALVGRILGESLGRGPLAPEDQFFNQGGDSLAALQAASRLRAATGAAVAIGDIFGHPGVRDLSALLASRLAGEGDAACAGAPCLSQRAPATPGQQGLYVLTQMEGASAAYNMPLATLLEGKLDQAALAGALQALVTRHEALRTAFTMEGGLLWQEVLPPQGPWLPVQDLTHLADPLARARELADEDAARPFDLERGRPIRTSLLRLGPASHVLLLNLHHIVCDGWSIGVIFRELAELYAAAKAGRPPRLSALAMQYRDYAAGLQERLDHGELAADRRFWSELLSPPPPRLDLDRALDGAGPASAEVADRRFDLGADLAEGLRRLAATQGLSLFTLLLAGVYALLHRYTGQSTVVLGTSIATRDRAELADQVGYYLNTLPLPLAVAPDRPFSELLDGVRRLLGQAFAHAAYPFELMARHLGLRGTAGRGPLIDVMVVLQGAEEPSLQLDGLAASKLRVGSVSAKYDLILDFAPRGDSLSLRVESRATLISSGQVERLVDRLRRLFAAVAESPDTPVEGLEMEDSLVLPALTPLTAEEDEVPPPSEEELRWLWE